MTSLELTAHEVRVTPRSSLARNTLLSGAFSLAPVFAALLWLTRGSDLLPVVALGEIVVTSWFFAFYLRFRMVYAAVTATHLEKRSLHVVTRRIPRSAIRQVTVTRVFRPSLTETVTHLVAFGDDGRPLLRLNGLWWSESSVLALADVFDVELDEDATPLTAREYAEAFPTARPWYERQLVVLLGGGLAIVMATLAYEALRGLLHS